MNGCNVGGSRFFAGREGGAIVVVVVVVVSRMTAVSCQQWGEVAGPARVDLWVLQSSSVRVEVLTLGAIIRSVCCRGRDGRMEDVVLGYEDLEGVVRDRHLQVDCIETRNKIPYNDCNL